MKISKNLRFSDVFREYRNGILALNRVSMLNVPKQLLREVLEISTQINFVKFPRKMVMYFSKFFRSAAFKKENLSDYFSIDLPSDKYLLVVYKPHRRYMVPSIWTNNLDKRHPSLQCNVILYILNPGEQKKSKTESPYNFS